MKQWLKISGAALMCLVSLHVAAERITIRQPDELRAISRAKAAVGGGDVISTDHDLTNWDVNLLRGCYVFEVEVSHSTGRVVSLDKRNYCGDMEALKKIRLKISEYQRTHR